MRIVAILCLRNEAAFLLEWLAHHRAVGITDFLVYANDCQDGTDRMLDRLADLGWLTHIPNDGPHKNGVQWTALTQAARHPLVTGSEWILPLDIDEFVNIHVGDGTIPSLLARLPGATAITLTWRFFGNGGVVEFRDAPVTDQFRRAAPSAMPWPWRASMFKTLFRNDGTYGKLGVHRPRQPDDARLASARWFDGSGRRLPEAFHRNRLFSPIGHDNHALAQLNHYALGAMESYVLKCDRGRANRASGAMGISYWVDRNWNQVEDRSIDRMNDRSRPLLDELKSDAVLGPLHEAGVRWRRARFAALMRDEEARALFGRLIATPGSRLPDADQIETLHRYAKAAQKP